MSYDCNGGCYYKTNDDDEKENDDECEYEYDDVISPYDDDCCLDS